jgi:CRISPR-associated exonuclease Cas4
LKDSDQASRGSVDQRLIPLSALQHFAFCPRQCALIHNEQVWSDNYLTAHGQLLHQRVDSGEPETRKGIRFERAVQVNAPLLGLTGKLDLVEFERATGCFTPVEYKRGKVKPDDWDEIQLCAQALCLEEMTGKTVTQGALWYWQTRRRESVELGDAIRERTMAVIAEVAVLFASGRTPKAQYGKHCKACSLIDLCNPQLVNNDRSAAYAAELFKTD